MADHDGDIMLSKEILSEREKGRQLCRIVHIDGILGSFPIIGPFYSALRSNLQMEKVIERLQRLEAALAAMGVNDISRDFYETDEGYDLLMNVCQHVSRTHSQEKIERFARIVQGVLNDKQISCAQADEYLSIIAQATDEEILVMTLLKTQLPSKEYAVEPTGDLAALLDRHNVPFERQQYIFKRIESMGMFYPVGTIAMDGNTVYSFTAVANNLIEVLSRYEE